MKTLQEISRLLFISVVGGLVLFFAQNHFEEIERRSGIQAELYSGPWAPRPTDNSSFKEIKLDYLNRLIDERNSVARLEISNFGSTTLEKAKIVFRGQGSDTDVLIVDPELRIGKFHADQSTLVIPSIAPGDSITIFLWRSSGFGWPNFATDMTLYSNVGSIPVQARSHPDESGYGDDSKTGSFWEFLYNFWYLIIPIISIFMFILSIASDHIASKYYKKLLLDDDFWIRERERIDELGQKRFVPDLQDLSLP